MYAHRARQAGASDGDIDVFVIEALFATVTNVNFDPERLAALIGQAAKMRDRAKALYGSAADAPEQLTGPAVFTPAADIDGLAAQAADVGIEARKAALGEDVAGLQELILYGLKGAAAYADHAQVLGQEDGEAYAAFHETLDFLTRTDATIDELAGAAFKVGEVNLKVMEPPTPAPTAIPSRRPSASRPSRARPSLSRGTISRTSRNCSSRPRARASTSTHTARCSPATPIRG